MIENKVTNSGLITFNLEDLYPEGERVQFDFKDWLFEELILKEKDFREYIKNHNWSQYQNKYIAVTCSADAIIPAWSYMLIFSRLQPFAKKIVFGDLNSLEEKIFDEVLAHTNLESFRDQRIVIKGCSNKPIPVSVYASLTALLQPVVKSIMFGEPCSTVPLYKRKDS